MKTKSSCVADCWSSVQYMFHRERCISVDGQLKFLISWNFYTRERTNCISIVRHRVFKRLKSRLTLEQTCMRQIWSSGVPISQYCRSQWPRGLRRRSAAARLLRLWVRIQPWAWMFVCCECCVLSGRGLCDEPITRPEESYRLWCVVVCDLEASVMRRPCPTGGCCDKKKEKR